MGFIDIHTHIVPGVDDGSKSNKESVDMLKKAYEAGITTIIATPHFSKGFHDYNTNDIKRYCKAIEKYAREHIFAGFRVLPGQEIFYNDRSLAMIRSGEVLPLGDTNYILIEFAPDISYNALYQALREVTMTAFFPVLAHIEIYDCLKEKGCLDELKELGVLMQMNYYHLGGKFFDETTKWCKWLLKYGYVDILSTDMHNSSDKGPRMEKALSWMEKFLDDDYMEELTYGNAERIMGIPTVKAEAKSTVKSEAKSNDKADKNEASKIAANSKDKANAKPEQNTDAAAKENKAIKTEKTETAKSEADRAEKTDKADSTDKAETAGKADSTDKAETAGKAGKTANSEEDKATKSETDCKVKSEADTKVKSEEDKAEKAEKDTKAEAKSGTGKAF